MADLNVNKLLLALNVKETDKFVLIKEHDAADSNFIITHLIKQIFQLDRHKLCLVLLHNSLSHYQHVGKKLGYDLTSKINAGHVKTIEPMNSIFNELSENSHVLYLNTKLRSKITNALLATIKANVSSLKRDGNEAVYLIIDDLSHLIDIGVDFNAIMRFITALQSDSVISGYNLIINTHIGDDSDNRISTALEYNADVLIDVAALKTGQSQDVTGVIKVRLSDGSRTIHYKATEKEMRTFMPGESLNYLLR